MTPRQRHDITQASLVICGVPAACLWLMSLFMGLPYDLGWLSLGAAYVLFAVYLGRRQEEGFAAGCLASSGLFVGLLRLNHNFWQNDGLIILGGTGLIILSLATVTTLVLSPYQDEDGPAMGDSYNPDADWLEPIGSPKQLKSDPDPRRI